MLKRIVFLVLLGFSPIFAWALQGKVADGIYTNSTKGFQVSVPANITYIDDARETVFEAKQSNWSDAGRYSIVWLACPPGKKCPNVDDKTFVSFAVQGAQAIVKNLNSAYTLPVNLSFENGKFIKVNGNTAYQFIAKGTAQNIPAVWVETDINYKDAVGMAILLQRIDNSKPLDDQINWQGYNAFINSLKNIR